MGGWGSNILAANYKQIWEAISWRKTFGRWNIGIEISFSHQLVATIRTATRLEEWFLSHTSPVEIPQEVRSPNGKS